MGFSISTEKERTPFAFTTPRDTASVSFLSRMLSIKYGNSFSSVSVSFHSTPRSERLILSRRARGIIRHSYPAKALRCVLKKSDLLSRQIPVSAPLIQLPTQNSLDIGHSCSHLIRCSLRDINKKRFVSSARPMTDSLRNHIRLLLHQLKEALLVYRVDISEARAEEWPDEKCTAVAADRATVIEAVIHHNLDELIKLGKTCTWSAEERDYLGIEPTPAPADENTLEPFA